MILTPGAFIIGTLFVFFFGLCVGSFLNVCIYRIPRDESVIFPGSHCPACSKPIHFYDNIPVLSFFLLKQKCRSCAEPISIRYPMVEVLCGLLFTMTWLKFGMTPVVPVYWLFISGLVLGTFVDFDHMIIPDRVTWGGIIAGLILSIVVPSLHEMSTPKDGLIASAIGAAVGYGLLQSVSVFGRFIFKKDVMGYGDVKLLGAIGAFLGWQAVLFTIFLSSVIGSIVGVTLIFSKNKDWQTRIPYGPYLALAAIVWFLWGSHWWNMYVSWVLRQPLM